VIIASGRQIQFKDIYYRCAETGIIGIPTQTEKRTGRGLFDHQSIFNLAVENLGIWGLTPMTGNSMKVV
jgi:hypothetical protein